ncbi:SMI1/KNR4 family protein [Bacillus gobiensis]|uniref:SMI1/KNR4 family protein n=1 Tax=Bacillus gobiensis TaxID=1441095 RepID=UPI003D213575
MIKSLKNKLVTLYGNDQKTLRSGTALYGKKPEDLGWHSYTSQGLTKEQIGELEESIMEIQGAIPEPYRNFLSISNGAYLFDLISISGKGRDAKGMSYEETNYEPSDLEFDLDQFTLYKNKKKYLDDYFFFAESYVNGTVFAFDKNERVIEFSEGRLKKVREFESLDQLLERVFEVGAKHYRTKSFIEFE